MQLLSVRQPWAWAIARGRKRVENRNWAPSYRGPVAIYASMRVDLHAAESPLLWFAGWDPDDPVAAIGGIVAIVTLADGRVVQTPVWWYPRLLAATAEQRSQVELSPLGIHWPQLDEDIRVTSILRGMKAPGANEPDKPEPTDRQ